MKKQTKKPVRAWVLSIALVAVVGGSILFVGAVAGWFDSKTVTLSEEYYHSDTQEFMELDKLGYENLVAEKKSFVVFIDQEGCKTADNLQGFLQNYMAEHQIAIYKMMFTEMKETALHDNIKYYPSVAIISGGKLVTYLRADSDEDANIYNNSEALETWMNKWVKI